VITKDSKPVAALTPIDAADVELVRITPAQEKRLMAWIKSQPKKNFISAAAAVRYLKKEFAKRD
jgi:antitoxin (DNA-binding transcriptional repressor) of toxin-antitoxin stability system